ncbi:MAG: PKD domain-containing protein, partial [Pseudomonadota bacterium]|nr:PKD domain-containing protein [Pseudomonadota bacterium]
GRVRRDIQVIVINCPNNHAPLLSGPFYKEVCATNPVTFTINTNDYDPNDTLLIGWNAAIPGASWTDNNKQVKHPTGVMSWTPGEQHASPIPYVFTVTVKDDACPVNGSSTRAYQILVKPLPRANITVVDSNCGDYWFFANPIVGSAPTYLWIGNFNPGFAKTGHYMHYKFNGPGVYPYSMTMTAKQCSRTYFDTIVVDTFITVTRIDDKDVCYNDSVSFAAMYHFNSGPVSFQWSTSQNDTLQYKSFIVSKDTAITFSVSDTIGCTASDKININMHNHPVVDAGPNIRLCSYGSQSVLATYTFDESDADTVFWKNINGVTLSPNANITVNDSGSYICTVIDTIGCKGVDTFDVVVSPKLNAYAMGATICYGDTTTLNANTTGSGTANVMYKWYDGSTFVGLGQSIDVHPLSTTDFKLLITENIAGVECKDSSIVRVKVNPLPGITISPIAERCVSGINSTMLKLNDYVTTNPMNTSKIWTSPSPGLLPMYPGDKFNPIVGGPGTHKVYLEVENVLTGCKNFDSSIVKINPLPTVFAGDDDTLCTGDGSVLLNGMPLNPPGEWRGMGSHKGVEGTFGNWSFNPTAQGITNGGNYYIIYKYTNPHGCENEDTMRYTVYNTPNTNSGNYPDVCIGTAVVNLNGTPVGGTWSGTGVIQPNKFDPNLAGVGSHEITYNVNNVVCRVKDKTTITVNPLPTLTVGTQVGRTTFCSNDGFIELMGHPGGGTWTGTGVTGKYFNTGIVGSSQTSYTLTYTYTDQNTCTNSKELILTIRPKPGVIIDPSAKKLCYPTPYEVNATYSFADGVEWFKDNDSASGNFNSPIDQTKVGYDPDAGDLSRLYFYLYIKTSHSDNVCKPAYDSIKVLMSAIPDPNFGLDPKGACAPAEISFSDSSTIVSGTIVKWKWEFGDTNVSSAQNPVHTFVESGTYPVRLTVYSNADCERSTTKYANAYITPKAGFIPNPEVITISSPTIVFENKTTMTSPGIAYNWYFDDFNEAGGGTSSEKNPEYKYTDTGTYDVVLYVANEWGCKDTSTREIKILPDVIAYIPSAFSPDNIGIDTNNTYRVVADGFTEFELKIFSRWGELLYESNDYPSHSWNGSYLNTDAKVPMGVYVYVLKLKGKDGVDYKYSGTITL